MSVTTREHAATQIHPCVAALRATGILEDDSVPDEHPRDLSRAHGVWAVRLPDAGPVVVKTARFTQADGPGSLGAELFVYRLAQWCEPLRAALPRTVAVDEDAMVLVMEEVAGPEVSTSLLAANGPQLMRRLGEALGAIHRATAGLPIPPARPPHALVVLRAGTDATGVTADLTASPVVLAAANELRRPAGRSLVHHDLKWGNLAVGIDGLVILDWELAGSGDPAWDVGSLVAEHLTQPGLMAGAEPLLTGYAAGARLSRAALPVFARRVAMSAGVRVAQLALEIEVQGMPDGDGFARSVADQAVALLTGRPALEKEVFSWLSR